ncbi:MAG TPA: glycosyltransferase [Ktedonobacterales bacterium]
MSSEESSEDGLPTGGAPARDGDAPDAPATMPSGATPATTPTGATPAPRPPRRRAPTPAPAPRPRAPRPTSAASAATNTGAPTPAASLSPAPRRERGPGGEVHPAAPARRAGVIAPENTVFVSLCFEGPDVYSTAGGLGTRVTEFTEALAELGYETHLIFVGDPSKPGVETLVNGKLHLVRWSQWISKYYPNGVYDGEEQKLYDYNDTVPYHIYKNIAEPAINAGKIVVVIGEDWHVAEAISRTSDLLHWHNLRHRTLMLWNSNSLMSLHRINWGRLAYASTITTVSRYMKQRLWAYNVNPLVIPNGIPRRYLEPVDQAQVDKLRQIMQRGDPERLFLFKIGRFDPDKRWLMAVEALAHLKYSGHPVSMMIRGGIEPHGVEVLSRARHLGLHVQELHARRPSVDECMDLLYNAGVADIYDMRFFVPADFVRVCNAAADAVLANSGHEPFGLVGLEVMAAGGIAFTGSTGEDYAVSFQNAVALETDDPDEIVGYLLHMMNHPDERAKIQREGRRTAGEFTWEEVIDNLLGKLGYMARKQSIVLD